MTDFPYYPVQDVISRRIIGNKVYYLVKWKDYSQDQATWEYSGRLQYIKPLIKRYNSRVKAQKQRSTIRDNTSVCFSQPNSLKSILFGSDICKRGRPFKVNIFSNVPQNDKIYNCFSSQRFSRRNQQENNPKKTHKINYQREIIDKNNDPGNVLQSEKRQQGHQLYFHSQKIDFHAQEHSSNTSSQKQKIINQSEKFQSKVLKPIGMKKANFTQVTFDTEAQSKNTTTTINCGETNNKKETKGYKINMQRSVKVTTKKQSNLKRLTFLHKRDGEGIQFFLEEWNGQLSIVSGIQLLQRFPQNFLEYFQRVVLNQNID